MEGKGRKYTKRVVVTFKPEQWEQVTAEANQLGMATSTLIRVRALGESIRLSQ